MRSKKNKAHGLFPVGKTSDDEVRMERSKMNIMVSVQPSSPSLPSPSVPTTPSLPLPSASPSSITHTLPQESPTLGLWSTTRPWPVQNRVIQAGLHVRNSTYISGGLAYMCVLAQFPLPGCQGWGPLPYLFPVTATKGFYQPSPQCTPNQENTFTPLAKNINKGVGYVCV